MGSFEITARNRIIRHPERGVYDKAEIYPIIDEALFCHVGFSIDQQVYIIPTLHTRRGDEILIHGATSSRLMKYASKGNPLCIAVTLLDGLVLARSVFSHSANFRSAVIFGRGSEIDDPAEKIEALRVFTEGILPGRWDDARIPNAKELRATAIVSIPIELASAKLRQGPPNDEPEDYQLPVWAGVLPIRQEIGEPVADSLLKDDIDLPRYIKDLISNNRD